MFAGDRLAKGGNENTIDGKLVAKLAASHTNDRSNGIIEARVN